MNEKHFGGRTKKSFRLANSIGKAAIACLLVLGIWFFPARAPVAAQGPWPQIGADIDGEAANDESAWSVSFSADGLVVAIGAAWNDGNGSNNDGHVRVYENQSGTWTQIGADIDGEADGDNSGYSVSLNADGSVVAIGARYNDGNGHQAGHVRVYENQSGTWTQIGADIDGEAETDQSGFSVSLSADGSVVAIGADHNDGNGTDAGHVRVYENQSGTWTQIGADIDGEAADDGSGWSVSLNADGSVVAIGAYGNDGSGSDAGHVRVYENQSGTWTQIGTDIDGEMAGDNSGWSVSLNADGSAVAIGAHHNDGNGANAGHVRVFEILAEEADLTVSPPSAEIYPGDTVEVDLDVTNAEDLYGLQSLCTVDPSILETQSGAFGDLLDPANRLIGANVADAGAGTWFGGASLQTPATPVSGDGLFATLTYEALIPGPSDITCDPLASDIDGFELDINSVDSSVTVLAYGNITGTVLYQGRLDHSGIDVSATGIVSATDVSDAAGAFDLVELRNGSYDVQADADLYLPSCANVPVVAGQTAALGQTTLQGGDANDDDEISIGDATLVGANFGLDVPPGAADADLNADGRVNVQDLSIIGGNFGLTGCQTW